MVTGFHDIARRVRCHFKFRFLLLCVRFGKTISKVCEDFNSGAIFNDTNSFSAFRLSPVRSFGGAEND